MKIADHRNCPVAVDHTARSSAPPLSRADLRWLESAVKKGAQSAGFVGPDSEHGSGADWQMRAPRLAAAEVPLIPRCPTLFARFIRESYGRCVNPLRRQFSSHA
ncbi:MAG: hypothetical protein C0518_06870 [Opitutus sp.]|nr:hypothetical protein [Opitutus sp.]